MCARQSFRILDDRLTIIHNATPPEIDARAISDGLCSIIRNPQLRRRVYRALAADVQARLTLAVTDGEIVGRAVVAPSFGRWKTLPRVREFAIEVAREWRHTGLAHRLTAAALRDPAAGDEIIVAFTLPSAWDPEHERLTLPEYGRLLIESASRHGFERRSTDEPEVRWQRDAALLVRIGARVPPDAVAAFDRARFVHQRFDAVAA
jgi:hypothetical protein